LKVHPRPDAPSLISYSHDSDPHKSRVSALAARLRSAGLTVAIDQDKMPGGPDEGWEPWSERQVKDADRVLIVCTDAYRRRFDSDEAPGIGLGVVSEAHYIRQLLRNAGWVSEKFRVIYFTDVDAGYVPLVLQKFHHFAVHRDQDYRDLVAWLGGTAVAEGAVQWPVAPAGHEWRVADRKDVCVAFEQMITGGSTQRILLLRGASGSGKTTLVAELQRFASTAGVPCAHVDMRGCPTLDHLIGMIRLDLPWVLRGNAMSGHALIQDLTELQRPVVLIFDTWERSADQIVGWLETQLLPRLEKIPGLAVVVAGQQVPDTSPHGSWVGLAGSIELKPIEDAADWVEYVRRTLLCEHITEHTITEFIRATGGDPGLSSQLLANLARNYR
jgi:hypothetical protein